ncbi:hypothetical protein MES4922_180037 [Mesorhizobium ventifaucium]|uniref:Uncharacterized protein n=1 Tax=Mesorhizobium ventifaucium TaxID=666020 RepID=A0ABN8JIF7_9HYPH|nr:hypothetical protein MES4922_180037 [Mesorhizobium ventifaucium]
MLIAAVISHCIEQSVKGPMGWGEAGMGNALITGVPYAVRGAG